MTHLVGDVVSVSFIKNIKEGMDLCKIRIDFDELFIFYDKDDLNQFLNQRVEYNFRDDMVDGKIERVVTDIAILRTIQTVASVENVKLIPAGNTRTVCNFSINEVRFGEFKSKCVSYLSAVTRGASDKSKWCDMTMIDMDSREFNVRMFTRDPNRTENLDEKIESAIGCYVQYDITFTKYGYQTEDIYVMPVDVELSPEVEVAKAVVLDVIKSDESLLQLETVYKLVDNLTNIIDGEPGYMLVRMAAEIYLINALGDISTNLDIPTMKQAVVCSRLYTIPAKKQWSRPLLNVNKTSRIVALRDNDELMGILDPQSGRDMTDTQRMYIKVRGMVNDIIKIRRGIIDEKTDGIGDVSGYMSRFNGLL